MKKFFISFLIVLSIIFLVGCEKNEKPVDVSDQYENEIFYSLFVRSFADSNDDGIGDLNGITNNLDYLEELGITGIWLLPIFASPSYHGYDTTDYYKIQEEYGTMEDLENLLNEANDRNIKIILDLVINHTSDQHPWFINAKSDLDSEYRDFYVWNTPTDAHQEFVGGMVDLNLSSDLVKEEIFNIVDFYMDLGVGGFRIDAVKHFFAGLNENGNDTLFMLELNTYVKNKNKNATVVGEVWVNDHSILANYYRSQASYFNFYLQNEIKSKVGSLTNSRLLVSNLEKMYDSYRTIKHDFVDASFLSNHDMDRVASMGEYQNVANLKLASQLLLTLPGSPYIYYGDELGLKGKRYEGDTIGGKTVYDEYRRQPFIWGNDQTTTWLISDGSNVDTKPLNEQMEDVNSLFNTYKIMANLRKNTPALMYGNEFYKYKNNSNNIQGFIRVIDDNNFQEAVLIIINFSDNNIELNYNLNYLYGNSELKPKGMSIIEIPFDRVGEFI